ncbi:MAG: trypsin-like peptidase domain-containing protein [Microcystis sp. M20BS1]|uniref:trypsin-like peptidase domain-containing protein n=1 Tax=unclassified Microcystis TaxID=2643300 RepID=UPI00257C72FB|nr:MULTISPECIES: trypsin-like peptidase domain-containing protein [unclassified Microcystis]MCA2623945.1 trypsin-like peptidase domain-containing protein [Microcystis sp. M19BS1]MCA2634648.1 trypsin-like peptidase domain-containing protein [Microcystis sp. M20BS1]
MIKRWFAWLGIVSILIPFPVAIAQLDQSQLKEITVRIDVEGSYKEDGGSGVIVRQQGQFYTILTAYHVVQEKRNYKVLIFNPSNQQIIGSHIINEKNIKQIDDYDLAEITIQSSAKYRTANIGDSQQLQPTDDLTVSGYPLPSSKITKRLSTPTLNLGKFNDKLPPDALLKGKKGATLKMDVTTEVGMSGGAVVNKNGELVGILVEADKDASGNKSSSLAIPIDLYPQWQAIRNSQRLSSHLPSPNQTLEQLLAAKKWGQANDKTWEILLKEGDADQSGDLDSFEVKNLECSTLKYLDVKWQQASGGEYGFKVQRGIYSAYHSEYNRDNPESNIDKYTAFAQKVGWFNNIQEISKDLSPNSLYSRKKTNRGFYPIWFVYGEKIEKIPFGLPVPIYNNYNELDDLYKYREPWQSEGTSLYGRLLDCL